MDNNKKLNIYHHMPHPHIPLCHTILLGPAGEEAVPDPFVAVELAARPRAAFLDQFAGDGGVGAVHGLDLDQEFVADGGGAPGRLGGEGVEVAAAGLGEREHPFVGPAFLLYDPCLDQAVLREALQFAVELLRCGHPEVRHRRVKILCQVIAGRLALEKSGQHGITQRHRSIVRHLINQQSD